MESHNYDPTMPYVASYVAVSASEQNIKQSRIVLTFQNTKYKSKLEEVLKLHREI